MKCSNCSKEIINVVTDSKQVSRCEHCYNELVSSRNLYSDILDFSSSGIEKYYQSEIAFNGENANIGAAIDLCLEASLLGNPHAIINQGYYLKTGYIKGSNTSEAMEKALNCFYSIAVYDGSLNNGLSKVYQHIELNPELENKPEELKFIKALIPTAVQNAFVLLNEYIFPSDHPFGDGVKQDYMIDILKKYLLDYYHNNEIKKEEVQEMARRIVKQKYESNVKTQSLNAFVDRVLLGDTTFMCYADYFTKSELLQLVEDKLKIETLNRHYRFVKIDASHRFTEFTNLNDFKQKTLAMEEENAFIVMYKRKPYKESGFIYVSDMKKYHKKKYSFSYSPKVFQRKIELMVSMIDSGGLAIGSVDVVVSLKNGKNSYEFITGKIK